MAGSGLGQEAIATAELSLLDEGDFAKVRRIHEWNIEWGGNGVHEQLEALRWRRDAPMPDGIEGVGPGRTLLARRRRSSRSKEGRAFRSALPEPGYRLVDVLEDGSKTLQDQALSSGFERLFLALYSCNESPKGARRLGVTRIPGEIREDKERTSRRIGRN